MAIRLTRIPEIKGINVVDNGRIRISQSTVGDMSGISGKPVGDRGFDGRRLQGGFERSDNAEMLEELSQAAASMRRRSALDEESGDELSFLTELQDELNDLLEAGVPLPRTIRGKGKSGSFSSKDRDEEDETLQKSDRTGLHHRRVDIDSMEKNDPLTFGNYLSAALDVNACALGNSLDISGGVRIKQAPQNEAGFEDGGLVMKLRPDGGGRSEPGYRISPLPGYILGDFPPSIAEAVADPSGHGISACWTQEAASSRVEIEGRILAAGTLSRCLEIVSERYPAANLHEQLEQQLKEFGTLLGTLADVRQRERCFVVLKSEQMPHRLITICEKADSLVRDVNRRTGGLRGISGETLARRLIEMAG